VLNITRWRIEFDATSHYEGFVSIGLVPDEWFVDGYQCDS